jgi:hypothetical protein
MDTYEFQRNTEPKKAIPSRSLIVKTKVDYEVFLQVAMDHHKVKLILCEGQKKKLHSNLLGYLVKYSHQNASLHAHVNYSKENKKWGIIHHQKTMYSV